MNQHPALSTPQDPDVVLSRYLSLGKLLDLLSTKSLFLSKVSKLGDRFEGSLTIADFNARGDRIQELFSNGPGPIEESMQKFTRVLRENTFVNCWTLGEVESEAMWRLYCGGDEGLCIRTTFKRLQRSIRDSRVYATQVRYLDYSQDCFPSDNAILGPFSCKRQAFEHEREFRLIVTEIPPNFLDDHSGPVEIPDVSDSNPDSGVSVDVEPDTLIESVLISPFASDGFLAVVTEAARHYLPDLNVRSSSLSGQPLY